MIRATRKGDHARLIEICRAAFPEEDLVPLLRDLLADDTILSLTTETRDGPVAHVILTPCAIDPAPREGQTPEALAPGEKRGAPAMLLGPVAVAPDHQGRGVGSKLIADALGRVATRPAKPPVLVLGDPNYYGRFGFTAEPNVAPPYALPEGWEPAWQSLSLSRQAVPKGTLRVPAIWLHEALWTE
ncbi:MAG: N-acetyltransferase [Pseudomonadota bacterium]